MFGWERTLSHVGEQLVRLRSVANAGEPHLLRTVPKISAWCPAEHLDHLTKVSNSIFRRLASADAAPVHQPISVIGRLVLMSGWIPRGRGKAPERLRGARVTGAVLLATLEELETLLGTLDRRALAKSNVPVVPHPKFGGLTPSQALRFVAIHNDHHLQIIDEIGRAV